MARWCTWRERRAGRLLLRSLRQVYRWRRDLLPTVVCEEMQKILHHPMPSVSEGVVASERVRELLATYGGPLWPQRFFAGNGEALLVAAIAALAIRTFFVQPFSIPTNSMWPTHRGMGAEIWTAPRWPSLAVKLLRGGKFYSIVSPNSGEISIPLNGGARARRQGSLLSYDPVILRRCGIWPVRMRRYQLLVGSTSIAITVPEDFDVESLLVRRFFPNSPAVRLSQILQNHPSGREAGQAVLRTGETAKAGEPLLRFLLIHGDVLLVDRITAHYRPPRRGEAVVFATRAVPRLYPDDRYYIKRLVGLGGDRLAIADGQLWANGEPANFSTPMAANNGHISPFLGYIPMGLLETVATVPPDHAFVLGDNSINSYDSRFFGPIPLPAVLGRPLLRIYPFFR